MQPRRNSYPKDAVTDPEPCVPPSPTDLEDAYRRHRVPLYNYFRRCGAPRDAADDLTQSVFALAADGRYDAARGPIRFYLFGIARNLRRDWQRRERHEAAWTTERGMASDTDARLDVARAVATLPDDQREALVLREMHGFSYEEIALLCEVPVGTVRSRLSRAREALRAFFTRGR